MNQNSVPSFQTSNFYHPNVFISILLSEGQVVEYLVSTNKFSPPPPTEMNYLISSLWFPSIYFSATSYDSCSPFS